MAVVVVRSAVVMAEFVVSSDDSFWGIVMVVTMVVGT